MTSYKARIWREVDVCALEICGVLEISKSVCLDSLLTVIWPISLYLYLSFFKPWSFCLSNNLEKWQSPILILLEKLICLLTKQNFRLGVEIFWDFLILISR